MKKIIAALFALATVACLLTGCGSTPEETEKPEATPTPAVESTPTPEPATPTPEPATPTPEPIDPSTLYEWMYYYDTDYGYDAVTIKLKDGITQEEIEAIKELEVPAEVDGHIIREIPTDLLGGRSTWNYHQGFMNITGYDEQGNPEWKGDANCYVEKLTFPETIEFFANDIFDFYQGEHITEFIFKGTDNITGIAGYAFHGAPAEVLYCNAHGGSMVLNGILAAFAVDGQEDYVCPDNVTEIGTRLCHKANVNYDLDIENDYDYLETFTVNEGCKKIGKGIFECANYVEWIYIPASVTEIGDYLCNDDAPNRNKLVVKAPAGSYAIEWAQAHSYQYEVIGEESVTEDPYYWDTYVDGEGRLCPYIVVADGHDRTEVVDMVLPETVNGQTVTYIPFDFLGMPLYAGVKGLAGEDNKLNGLNVATLVLPATIEAIGLDGNPFIWDASNIEIEFLGDPQKINWGTGVLPWAIDKGYYEELPD